LGQWISESICRQIDRLLKSLIQYLN